MNDYKQTESNCENDGKILSVFVALCIYKIPRKLEEKGYHKLIKD